jgi:hypothetical protein
MEKFYTQNDIDRFLRELRNFPEAYKLEKVHHLINDPHAMARHRIKLKHKPFNFIIMTSAIIAGVTALLFWSNPKKAEIAENKTLPEKAVTPIEVIAKNTTPVMLHEVSLKKTNPSGKTETRIPEEINPVLTAEVKDRDIKLLKIPDATCAWSSDTVIDKKILLLNLSDDELKAIGILRKGNATFYHNIIPGFYDRAIFSDGFTEKEEITTYNKFYIRYITNSNYEPSGPGNFYSEMDTLVPVAINDKHSSVYWFNPDKSLFKLLPNRYAYLESDYENLICLKKKYPEKSFTNFIEPGKERILDPVTVLDLDRESLNGIGVVAGSESVKFQSRNKNYTLEFSKTGSYSNGNSDDMNIFPPNPYPVIMTDTLGRRVYTRNTIPDTDSLSKIMNILVPVRIRINEYAAWSHEVIICWFYPTPEFIKALPSKTGVEISSELMIIKNNTKTGSSSCNYFEVCKSTIKLDKFKLYPNPASQTVSIEFENATEIIGSISIVNMAGIKLRELLPKTTFVAGRNYYQMDLSGISPGMYLISINTGKGFRTQRLIVTR